jgi:predicted NACHT family NTPase
MTSSLSNKRWVYLCLWLWKLLQWIWGAIIFALLVNIGSTWLTSKPQQFDLVGTPIGWLLEHLNISIPLGGGLIVLSIITSLVTALNSQLDQQSLSVAQEERNRNHFLKRLDDHYNKLLEQYLPKNLPQIPLSFHSKPNAIQKNTVLLGRQHQPEQPGSTPSASTSIFQVYKKEAREELLILGEPGAGKTTLLLQLARDLRDQAEQELKDPLPLIVNLSTWANTTRLSLEEWLAEEVAMRYHVSKSLTRHWVKHNQLLPLLDGLDEMPGDRQLTCIDAINTYKQNHLGPLVVCCRSKAYDTLSRKLNLHTAVGRVC